MLFLITGYPLRYERRVSSAASGLQNGGLVSGVYRSSNPKWRINALLQQLSIAAAIHFTTKEKNHDVDGRLEAFFFEGTYRTTTSHIT